MPKKVPDAELDAIATLVAHHPDGVRVDVIRAGLHYALPARMMQRRLNRLAEAGRIVGKGSGRGKRYFPGTTPSREVQAPNFGVTALETGGIGLTEDAEEVRKQVSRPLSARTPVGYESGFLDFYEPNVSEYLSPKIRCELAAIGKVGMTNLPAGTYVRQVMDRLLIDLSWNSSRLEGNT